MPRTVAPGAVMDTTFSVAGTVAAVLGSTGCLSRVKLLASLVATFYSVALGITRQVLGLLLPRLLHALGQSDFELASWWGS